MKVGSSQSGFTLLEIVIAMAIAALSLAVVYTALIPVITRYPQTNQSRMQLMFAQSLLDQATIIGEADRGTMDLGKDSTAWTIDLSPFGNSDDHAGPAGLMLVNVTVSSSRGSVTLQRIVLIPDR